jgi:tetratricopeptide (TPR) repeat protein
MSSSSSTTRAKARKDKPPVAPRRTPSRGEKLVTWSLLSVWVMLISFAVLSLANPNWVRSVNRVGREVESRSLLDQGDLAARQGRLGNAIENYKRALEIKPDLYTAQVNLAAVYLKLKRTELAENVLRHALTLSDADKGFVYYQLGELYEQRGEAAEAEANFRLALQDGARAGLIHRQLGALRYHAGDMPAARDELELALASFTSLTAPYLETLYTSLAINQNDSVNRVAIESLLAQPCSDSTMAIFDTTLMRQVQGRDPEISHVHSNLGIVYVQLRDYTAAIEHFGKALDIWPENTIARDNLAVLLRTQSSSGSPDSE